MRSAKVRPLYCRLRVLKVNVPIKYEEMEEITEPEIEQVPRSQVTETVHNHTQFPILKI